MVINTHIMTGGGGITITSLTVSTMPTITEYLIGEEIDYTGLECEIVYSNGTVSYVDKTDLTFNIPEGTVLTQEQTYTIVASFGTASTTFNVIAKSLTIVTWANGTDAEIMAMIDADRAGKIDLHDYWAVGDERVISLSAMSATYVGESHAAQNVTMVLVDATCTGFTYTTATKSGRTKPRFIVQQKDCLNELGYMNASYTSTNGWSGSQRRTWCNATYKNAFPATIQNAFKQFTWKTGRGGTYSSGVLTTDDYFGLAPEKAVFGSRSYSFNDEAALYSQWTYYITYANIIKKVNGSDYTWWLASPVYYNYGESAGFFVCANLYGGGSYNGAPNDYGIAPFGCI